LLSNTTYCAIALKIDASGFSGAARDVKMKCPYCGHAESKVVDKRDAEDAQVIRRRRECLKCEKRWTTFEKIEVLDLTVIKKDGRKEPFERAKLEKGITIALEKRPVPENAVNDVVNEIEAKLRTAGRSEVTSAFIGELVMKRLKKLDEVAYMRFASVYKEFTDLGSFKKEIKTLQK
jgi:transcriptional repressor NrdR